MRAQLASASTTKAAPAPVVSTAPATISSNVSTSGGKIVGKLLSMRREIKANKDNLIIGVSLTNATNRDIHGVLVGPEITAIDNANNMFAIKDHRWIKGITMCQYGHKLYNTMSWCEQQLEKKQLSSTSFRPGVPVNVLITLPAINSDPNAKTEKLNATTLFLLLEGEEKGTYEKYPVDIR